MTTKAGPSKLKFIKEKGEVKEELIIITEVGTKADTGQTVDRFSISPYRGRPQYGQNFRKETGKTLGTAADLIGIEVGHQKGGF